LEDAMKYLMTTAAALCATAAWAETPILTVYAGDYFTSEWGPGPKIEAGFEEISAISSFPPAI
jgi:thiamine transport system substrate-binding protein